MVMVRKQFRKNDDKSLAFPSQIQVITKATSNYLETSNSLGR